MKIKTSPADVYAEYTSGVSYNQSLDMYTTVKKNNEFYNGDQWEDVNAPDLDKPVFNFIKQACNYYETQLISDDVSVAVEVKKGMDEATDAIMPLVIKSEVDHVIEQTRLRLKHRTMIKNCIVDGDGCHFLRFDPDVRTGFDFKGAIDIETIDNTNVMFGSPSELDVQKQPYILIVYRKQTESVKTEAQNNKQDPNNVVADDDQYLDIDGTDDNDYTTVVLKLWKDDDGIVNYTKISKNAVIKPPKKLGYYLYPVAYMTWERVKNSYHGKSPVTSVINNQKFVNKLYAMAMMFTQKMAFPKILYDANRLPKGWDNRIGKAIGISGSPNDVILSNFSPADMTASVPNLILSTIQQTKDSMGVYDTAVGAVDNVSRTASSAVMMLQKASSSMLEVQKLDFKSFVEDEIRIIVDMMRVHYGTRPVSLSDSEGNIRITDFNFKDLEKYIYSLNVEVGSSAYWSEVMQVQTLNNMMQMGILDPIAALTATPDGNIKNKDKIIEHIKKLQNEAMQSGGMPNEEL